MQVAQADAEVDESEEIISAAPVLPVYTPRRSFSDVSGTQHFRRGRPVPVTVVLPNYVGPTIVQAPPGPPRTHEAGRRPVSAQAPHSSQPRGVASSSAMIPLPYPIDRAPGRFTSVAPEDDVFSFVVGASNTSRKKRRRTAVAPSASGVRDMRGTALRIVVAPGAPHVSSRATTEQGVFARVPSGVELKQVSDCIPAQPSGGRTDQRVPTAVRSSVVSSVQHTSGAGIVGPVIVAASQEITAAPAAPGTSQATAADSKKEELANLSVSDVQAMTLAALLQLLGLEQYLQAFQKERIDTDVIHLLNADELLFLITNKEDRVKLRRFLKRSQQLGQGSVTPRSTAT